MKTYDYKNVEFVAHVEKEAGQFVVYALIDGVEVPIAAHKIGHFAHKLKEGREKRLEAEAEKASAPATATVEQPVVPHSPTEPSPTVPTTTPSPTQ